MIRTFQTKYNFFKNNWNSKKKLNLNHLWIFKVMQFWFVVFMICQVNFSPKITNRPLIFYQKSTICQICLWLNGLNGYYGLNWVIIFFNNLANHEFSKNVFFLFLIRWVVNWRIVNFVSLNFNHFWSGAMKIHRIMICRIYDSLNNFFTKNHCSPNYFFTKNLLFVKSAIR